MLAKSISTSRKVGKLKTDQARLLFTWMIPHADDWGRLEGDPETIRVKIIPRLSWTIQQVTDYLEDITSAGLIDYYTINNEHYIQIDKWLEHQTFHGIQKIPSKIPPPEVNQTGCSPPDMVDSDNISIIKSQPDLTSKLSKVKLSKVKLSKESNIAPTDKRKSVRAVPLIAFSFEDKKFEGITDQDVTDWQQVYPACNVEREIAKMAMWLLSNPEKRKIKYRKFITNWLSRTQDKGGTR